MPKPSHGARRHALPPFQPVQLATLVDHVPPGRTWLHELKHDGYRCLLAIGDGEARAYTRSGLDWSAKFPTLVEAGRKLAAGSALIDGEAVVLDAEGRSSFQALQSAIKEAPHQLLFYAFDLLELDGVDLKSLPQIERKSRLEALLKSSPKGPICFSTHTIGDGEAQLEAFCGKGMEGVISKRADAPYAAERSKAWLKIKCIRREEFVVVGWTPSDKDRGFRALLLATHENGRLRYAGKVGAGFDMAEIDQLLAAMKPLSTKSPPVDAPRGATKDAHWIKPSLVVEIAYTEMTTDGLLRHPSYLGQRHDKKAEAVLLERVVPMAEAASARAVIKITNPDRVIFPETGQTKGDLAAYYLTLAPAILPWLANRPMSLVRCPQGRAKKCFFQKHDAGSFGENVKQVVITEKDGSQEPYLFIDSAEGISSCVQMGAIEFHSWGARIEDVEKPDRVVFDLDPDEGLSFEAVKAAAALIGDRLAGLGLVTFPMVTGGKGVHVIAPLNPRHEWPAVKAFAADFAQTLAQQAPEQFTAALAKAQRGGKIFIDYLRNQRGATAVTPYGVRARANAPVAVPVTWLELASLDSPARWTVDDADDLLARSHAESLAQWGRADQVLPGG